MSPRQHRALCEKLDIAPLGCICELQELDAGNGGALLWNRLTDQGWRVTLSTWPGKPEQSWRAREVAPKWSTAPVTWPLSMLRCGRC